MLKPGLKYDSGLFLIVLILLVVGVVMVYSASSFKAQERYEDSHFFLKNHFYKVILGLVLLLIAAKIDYRIWLKISPLLIVAAFAALLYLLAASDIQNIRGSKRWLTIAGLQFQPSDFARIALILWLSCSLGKVTMGRGDTSKNFTIRLFVISIFVITILLQPDVGTALLLAVIAITLLFVGGEKLRHLFVPGILATVFLAIALMQQSYQKARIVKFIASLKGGELHWQSYQSLLAFGNGGVFGLGLGGSRQKYHFLPDPFTDFIYAIVGEELGIFGALGILILFISLAGIGFKIAFTTQEKPARLLAFGIVFSIAIYAITNMAVVLNLLPTTGIPMPFLSYGGSSLLVNLFGVGILLNIAHQNQQKMYPVGAHRIGRINRRHG